MARADHAGLHSARVSDHFEMSAEGSTWTILSVAVNVVPSERQINCSDGVYGFIHFGINTFTDRGGNRKRRPRVQPD